MLPEHLFTIYHGLGQSGSGLSQVLSADSGRSLGHPEVSHTLGRYAAHDWWVWTPAKGGHSHPAVDIWCWVISQMARAWAQMDELT